MGTPRECAADTTAAVPSFLWQLQVPSEIALPDLDLAGKRVLDIGCGTGKDLLHPLYARAADRCGIDTDESLIRYGQRHYPTLKLCLGVAEALPYRAAEFDFVVSRVALPYTNVPIALAEIARVMKHEAPLLLTLHDHRYQFGHWAAAARRLELKTLADAFYVLGASAICCLGFEVPARPRRHTRTTFVSQSCARRLLARAGFVAISFEKTAKHFIVRAIRQ